MTLPLAVEDIGRTLQIGTSLLLGVFVFAAVMIGYRPLKGWVFARERMYERDLRGGLLIDVRPRTVTYLTGAGMVVMALLCYGALNGWLGMVLGLGVGAFLPPIFVRVLRRRRIAKLEDQLVSSIRTLASGVRAGLNLVQAMELVARDGPVPASQEYNHLLREYEYGVPLETAMNNATRRIGSSDYQLLFAALLTHRERGGDLGETLDRIAESIREIQRLESRVKTLTAQGRTTARWLGAMPAVVLGILYLIEPVWVQRLFVDIVGQFIVLLILVLNVIGYLWIRKIVSIDI